MNDGLPSTGIATPIVLITGGTGMVGRAIRDVFGDAAYGHRLVYLSSADTDLRSAEATARLFLRLRPRRVIHLAARVGGLFRNMRERVAMLEDNVMINLNVLRAAHKAGVPRLVAVSSTCIFPDGAPLPLTEGMVHDGPPHDSNAPYAHAKRLLHVLCRAYREEHGLQYTCLIPTNLYGPHDNFDLEDGHMIPCLIRRCVEAHGSGGSDDMRVRGTGRPRRQLLFSEDLARVLMWSAIKDATAEDWIVAPPAEEEKSIREIAEIIAAAVRFRGAIVYDGDAAADGQARKTAAGEPLRARLPLGWTFTPVNQGIERTVAWYRAHSTRCRGGAAAADILGKPSDADHEVDLEAIVRDDGRHRILIDRAEDLPIGEGDPDAEAVRGAELHGLGRPV